MSGQRSVAQYGHHSAPTYKTVGLPSASATGWPEMGCGPAVEVPAPTADSALAGTWVTAATAACGAAARSLPLLGLEATFAMNRAAITAATIPTAVIAWRRRRVASAACCSACCCAARARARFLLWLDIRLLDAPALLTNAQCRADCAGSRNLGDPPGVGHADDSGGPDRLGRPNRA